MRQKSGLGLAAAVGHTGDSRVSPAQIQGIHCAHKYGIGLRNAGGCDTVSVDMDDADRRGVAGAFILGVALPTAAALILLLFS